MGYPSNFSKRPTVHIHEFGTIEFSFLFFGIWVDNNDFHFFLIQVHTKTVALIQTPVLVSSLQTTN